MLSNDKKGLSGGETAAAMGILLGQAQQHKQVLDALDQQTLELQMAREAAEDQRFLAEQLAARQASDAKAAREAPEHLFRALAEKERILPSIDAAFARFRADNSRTAEVLSQLDLLRAYLVGVFAIQSENLHDFEHKRQLQSLQTECREKAAAVNDMLGAVVDSMNEGRLMEYFEPLAALDHKQVSEIKRDAAALKDVQRREEEGPGWGILLVGLSILGLILYGLFLWVSLNFAGVSPSARSAAFTKWGRVFLLPSCLAMVSGIGLLIRNGIRSRPRQQEIAELEAKWAEIFPVDQWETMLPLYDHLEWNGDSWSVKAATIEAEAAAILNSIKLPIADIIRFGPQTVVGTLKMSCPQCNRSNIVHCNACGREGWFALYPPNAVCECGAQFSWVQCPHCEEQALFDSFSIEPSWAYIAEKQQQGFYLE